MMIHSPGDGGAEAAEVARTFGKNFSKLEKISSYFSESQRKFYSEEVMSSEQNNVGAAAQQGLNVVDLQ